MERNEMIACVTRAQAGDNDALSTLFNEYYSRVYYFALKTVRDENTAADITQETFVQVITNIKNLRDPSLFGSWLRAVTYSRCTRYFSQKREILCDEDEEGNDIFDEVAEDHSEFIPDEALDRAEFRKTVMAIVDELPDEQRATVLMYYFDELSVRQIAAIQGVSEGTVKSRLNYARKHIKSAVEGYETKHGIKLHAALLPILFWVFSAESASVPMDIAATAGGIATATGTGLKVNTGSNVASAVGGGAEMQTGVIKNVTEDAAKRSAKKIAAEGVKKGAKVAVKKAGLSLGAKIAAGVTAVAVTAGVATGAVALVKKSDKKDVAETTAAIEQSETISNDLLKENTEHVTPDVFVNCEVGGYVSFGSFEQDGVDTNGTEAIEWLVLAMEGDKALVISKYAIDTRPYNNERDNDPIVWTTSDIRAWLNDEFYNATFNEEEKSRIELTHFNDEGTEEYDDNIFLLSVEEAEKYFDTDEARQCDASEYSKSKALTIENGYCWWLLRTPGKENPDQAAYVEPYGCIQSWGDYMYGIDGGIRPAMWVNTTGVAQNSGGPSIGTEDVSEAVSLSEQVEKYNSYLTNGGYQKIADRVEPYEMFGSTDFTTFSFSSYLEDIDNDGIYEVLLSLTDELHQNVDAFLDIVDNEVVCVKAAYHGGGTGGGAYLFITTDANTGERVFVYSEGIRGGWAEQHSTCIVYSGTDHTELVRYKTSQYRSYDADALSSPTEEQLNVMAETDLYVIDGDAFRFYEIDDEYVSEADYNALNDRFVDNYDTEMIDGSYEVPIRLSVDDTGVTVPSDSSDTEDDAAPADIVDNTEEEIIVSAEMGDIITFGNYEQDNDTSNGSESIEWVILAKEDGKTLVISKYAIDCRAYNDEYIPITWETCDMRAWLNNDFYNVAFDDSEKQQIATTYVENTNRYPDVDAGNDTNDKIFILSSEEADLYFDSDFDRKCEMTEYTKSKNPYNKDGFCSWWLRTHGYNEDRVNRVSKDGNIGEWGGEVDDGRIAIRPAMWIINK